MDNKIELVCSCCGNTLEYRLSEDGIQGNTLYVSTCGTCLIRTKQDGYESGEIDGYSEGYSAGYGCGAYES